MELPENRGLLLYILLMDLMYGIITEIIGLSTRDKSSRDAAIASLFFFFVVVVIFGGFILGNIIYHIKKKDKKVRVRITLLLVQSVGAVLYFYGDNSISLVTTYGSDVGCGSVCVQRNKVAAMIASGAVLLFFHEFPSCLHKIVALLDYSEPNTGWFSATRMIGTYVRLDALYNIVVVAAADLDEFCNTFDLAITVTFFIICVLTGTGLMFVYSIYTWKQLKGSDQAHHEWIVFLAFVLLTIFFPIYLLVDNSQPLDCAFGCDPLANNQTLEDLSCNVIANHGLRLSLLIITLVVISTISIVLFCCRSSTKGEKVI